MMSRITNLNTGNQILFFESRNALGYLKSNFLNIKSSHGFDQMAYSMQLHQNSNNERISRYAQINQN